MEITYEVPPHLIGYLSNLPQDKVNETITRALEHASDSATLQGSSDGKMLADIHQMLLNDKQKASVEMKHILTIVSDINNKLENGVAVSKSTGPYLEEKRTTGLIKSAKEIAANFNFGGDDSDDDDMEIDFLSSVIK